MHEKTFFGILGLLIILFLVIQDFFHENFLKFYMAFIALFFGIVSLKSGSKSWGITIIILSVLLVAWMAITQIFSLKVF